MSQSPITVTYPLEEILTRLEGKIDELRKDVIDLKVGQSELKTKVDSIDKRLEKSETEQSSLVKDIADLKGAKSLIIPIVVAVLTSLLTLLLRIIPNP